MTIYYLKPEKTVDEIINTLHASIASMRYFETLDTICEEVGFNLDEAAQLQQIKQLSDEQHADLKMLHSIGVTENDVAHLKAAGLLLFVQDSEIPQSYVMLSRKALAGLQEIAAVCAQEFTQLTMNIDSKKIQSLKAAADKVFRKYQ
ncbi:hypothetical protein [Latilactobacillus fragifolii]|uniref:hypothetical protein n=1 Tax=Latilactobacillus fragifolii TaxID=2814244 RepID=UPI001ABA41BF|nr:hypothetical protein [Latilactobacillus fragifolii]